MRPTPKIIVFSLLLLAAGCAHDPNRLGPVIVQDALPDGTPAPTAILAGLAANDAAIQNFRATGRFILKSPQLEETLLIPQSTITFRRPADLSVNGRKYGSPVGRLTCVGDEFLLEVVTRHEYLHADRGARFDSVSREVSPADIARETFLPEDWSTLGADRVRMVDYKAAEQRATFEVLAPRGKKVHRRVEVTGPPWVVVKSELLDDNGNTIAVTTKDDYHDNGDVRFAAAIRSEFPGENAFMEFKMDKFTLNEAVDPALFDIPARLDEIKTKDYVPMKTAAQQDAAPAPAKANKPGNKGFLK